jgi:aminoacyl tRNA synthase complex-interacting multifunctional protein 1
MRLRFQARLQPAQYHSYPSLSRYFDHIQSRPTVRKSAEALSPAFDLIRLDFSTAPPIERKALEAKKKEKPSNLKAAEQDATLTSTPAAINSPVTKKAGRPEGKPPKTKEKQGPPAEKAGKKTVADNNKATAASEDAGPAIPSMIDLRVGHIIEGTCVCECLPPQNLTLCQSKSTLMQTVFMLRQVLIAVIACRS